MEKIKNWLKNKSIGYYIAAGIAVVALIFLIIFAVTYKGQMGNKEGQFVPETIIAFLIAGVLVEAAVLALPQYKFIQIIAVAMFGMALYKDILIIPDFFAGMANGVMYNGGDLGLNMFYFVMLILIAVASVVAAFMGFYGDAKEENKDFKVDFKNIGQVLKLGVAGVVVIAAVLTSSLVSANLEKGHAVVETTYSPITQEMKDAADEVEYDFDPTSVIIKEQAEWDFSDSTLKGLQLGFTREERNLVYYFEGSYSEGWQGDYSPYFAEIYLWDDGMFVGKSNSTTFRGYWFNSSLQDGQDEAGNDIADCCIMKSNDSNFSTISTDAVSGFYQRQGYAYLNPGWGGRSVIISGYYYYPEVAMFIDANTEGQPVRYKVGDTFNRGSWVAKRVLKNLSYSAVFKGDSVKWTDEAGMYDSDKKLTTAGTYTVTATYNGFTAEQTVIVEE